MKRNLLRITISLLAFGSGYFLRAQQPVEYGEAYERVMHPAREKIKRGTLVEFASEYTNARVFQNAAREAHWQFAAIAYADSGEASFMSRCIKLIRQDTSSLEALSIPREPLHGRYYLVANDSVYHMLPIPVRPLVYETE